MRPAGQNELGKITEAYWAISQFPEEIEADLARYYHLELADLFHRGSSLTWRRLLVLLRHLPPESAVNTAIRNRLPDTVTAKGDPARGKWSAGEMLLAVLIDEIRQMQWIYVQAHTDKRIPRPSPIPRPGLPGRARRAITPESMRRLDPRLRGLSDEDTIAKYERMIGHGR